MHSVPLTVTVRADILIKTCEDLKILVPKDSEHNEEARLRKLPIDKPIGKYIDKAIQEFIHKSIAMPIS